MQKFHHIAKPKSGGLVFSSLAIIYDLISVNFNTLKILPITIIGFIDDKRGLSSSFRLISQFITCVFYYLIVKYSYQVNFL